MANRADGTYERFKRSSLPDEILIAEPAEVPLDASAGVRRIHPPATAFCLPAQSTYRLSPGAAQIVARRPTGGTHRAIADLLVSGRSPEYSMRNALR
jgi:hypothetical protein